MSDSESESKQPHKRPRYDDTQKTSASSPISVSERRMLLKFLSSNICTSCGSETCCRAVLNSPEFPKYISIPRLHITSQTTGQYSQTSELSNSVTSSVIDQYVNYGSSQHVQTTENTRREFTGCEICWALEPQKRRVESVCQGANALRSAGLQHTICISDCMLKPNGGRGAQCISLKELAMQAIAHKPVQHIYECMRHLHVELLKEILKYFTVLQLVVLLQIAECYATMPSFTHNTTHFNMIRHADYIHNADTTLYKLLLEYCEKHRLKNMLGYFFGTQYRHIVEILSGLALPNVEHKFAEPYMFDVLKELDTTIEFYNANMVALTNSSFDKRTSVSARFIRCTDKLLDYWGRWDSVPLLSTIYHDDELQELHPYPRFPGQDDRFRPLLHLLRCILTRLETLNIHGLTMLSEHWWIVPWLRNVKTLTLYGYKPDTHTAACSANSMLTILRGMKRLQAGPRQYTFNYSTFLSKDLQFFRELVSDHQTITSNTLQPSQHKHIPIDLEYWNCTIKEDNLQDLDEQALSLQQHIGKLTIACNNDTDTIFFLKILSCFSGCTFGCICINGVDLTKICLQKLSNVIVEGRVDTLEMKSISIDGMIECNALTPFLNQWTLLRGLVLEGVDFSHDQPSGLAEIIPTFKHLERLSITHCTMYSTDIDTCLNNVALLSKLKHLTCIGFTIQSPEAQKALKQLMKSPTLESLVISFPGTRGDVLIRQLIRDLFSSPALQTLSLEHSRIGTTLIKEIAEMLRAHTLSKPCTLDLSHNFIDDAGVQYLVDAISPIKHPYLVVKLDYNRVAPSRIKQFGHAQITAQEWYGPFHADPSEGFDQY